MNGVFFWLNHGPWADYGSAGHNRLVCKKSKSDVQARRRKEKGEDGEDEEEGRDPATTLQAMAGTDPIFLHFLCLIEDMHLTIFIYD